MNTNENTKENMTEHDLNPQEIENQENPSPENLKNEATEGDSDAGSSADSSIDGSELNGAEVNGETTVQSEREKYIRLYSEFENFRRRTAKERLDLIQNASKDIIESLLPVVDDLERAIKALQGIEENNSALEGMDLVYKKFYGILERKGLKPMVAVGQPFDAEIHEAVTQFTAPSPDLVGKVIDEVEKGYYLNDKVVRFAKVVVGN
jgi:molecular chaperone GrpE